jgi:hypothetical protein
MHFPTGVIEIIASYTATNRVESFVEGKFGPDSSIWNSILVWIDPDAAEALIAQPKRPGSIDLFLFCQNPSRTVLNYLREHPEEIDYRALSYNMNDELFKELAWCQQSKIEGEFLVHDVHPWFQQLPKPTWNHPTSYDRTNGYPGAPLQYRLVPEIDPHMMHELVAVFY